ncbi:hypothetical protein L1987_01580 [Smallanthus sonchifolius]|uniref:Uncharacterized protein n=2 Tax=Smallanthus sonchifolius TaxID=185202 RepID=A0ACB9K5I5_9ASTR|nr:hypothetical protein L1987_01579 [Smallanthus sonchifolius]KAI3827503.1 hypothetical protein L1987_01580 [Smallanthus sonchifolius]
MYLQLGQVPTVVISTPRLAQEVLKTHDAIFADRPTSEASELFFYKAQNIAWAPYGNYWRQMRKISSLELLSAKRVRTYSFIRDQELTHMRRSLESSAGRPTALREILVKYVNDVICRSTLGDTYKDQSTLVKVLFDIMIAVIQFNVTSYYPSVGFINVITGKKAKWLKLQKQFDNILEDILEQHRNNRPAGSHDQADLVDVLLRIQGSADLDLPITNDSVKAVILDMLVAGTSASSVAIEWAMTELMRKPDIMKKAQEELRATVKGNTITDADIQSMHYLKMIVKETLRLHGPPFLMPRISRKDCTVDGYHIPAKTRILVNALACGTDPDSWEDPESFIPERFEKSSINYLGADFELIPFGAGRRVCPGISFGVGIIENALATLLYHFDWKLPNGLKPHELDLTEAAELSILPKHPLHVIPIIMPLEK